MTGPELARAETLAVYGATVPEFRHGRSAAFWKGCRCRSCCAAAEHRDDWQTHIETAIARTGSIAAAMVETKASYDDVRAVLHRMDAA